MIKEKVINKIKNGVATINFSHPKQNCLTSNLLDKLTFEINGCSLNPKVKVIVLQSDKSMAFCAGASFDELISIKSLSDGIVFFSKIANLLISIKNCQKIVVSNVHGKVVGGGLGLLAASDYVIASQKVQIKLSELAIGIGPFLIAPLVRRKIGVSALSSLAYNPKKWKSSDWCLENGLINDVVDNEKKLNLTLNEFTGEVINYQLESLTMLKKVLWSDKKIDNVILENAEISARLLLMPKTQKILNKIK